MIKFDFDTDLRFRDSLNGLGAQASVDIFDSLATISAQQYSWDEFAYRHGWEPLALPAIDIFPGANELHQFQIQAASAQQYQIIGYTYENVVIICAIARMG
ncbi:MAG TPA: hypothetical protein VFX55_10560 [Duganella sp.]|nr:hypothetical protein [Duganella sp.]